MQTVSGRIEPHIGRNNACLEGSVIPASSVAWLTQPLGRQDATDMPAYLTDGLDGRDRSGPDADFGSQKAMIAQKMRKSQLSRPFLHVSVTPEARAVASNPAANCCS